MELVKTQPQGSITIEDADWLDHLTEEIQAIIVETGFIIRWSRISMYWRIGHAILDERERQQQAYEDNPARPKPASLRYIFQRVGSRLSQYSWLIGESESSLYYAVQFAGMFPDEESLEALPDGKNTSWRKIVQKVLPAGNEEEKRSILPFPIMLYQGLATLHCSGQGWSVRLPVNVDVDGKSGAVVTVVVKSIDTSK